MSNTNHETKISLSPLLKWTGGKYREYKYFSNIIPKFERYVEPFFGGGGVFFALEYSFKAFVNDKSEDLISFYKLLGDENFKINLLELCNLWDKIIEIKEDIRENIIFVFKNTGADKKEILRETAKFLSLKKTNLLFCIPNNNICKSECLHEEFLKNLVSKIFRLKKIEIKEDKKFTTAELADHIETALKSGFYMHLRSLSNQYKKKENNVSEAERIAIWFFVRELCYGSMFRFNKNGEFNIPYGGIAYNSKDIRKKINALFSKEVKAKFSSTTIYNLDFEDFLDKIALKAGDFIFLDPPYDSNFSEYDKNVFNKEDQARLANRLMKCKAKWLLVIKNTDYIFSLYDKEGIYISAFSKKYAYNVRSRNNRNVEHLIITNYKQERAGESEKMKY